MSVLRVPRIRSQVGRFVPLVLASLAWALSALPAAAQNEPLDNRFRYQGELRDGGVVIDGPVDFKLRIYDQLVGGNLVSFGTQLVNNVPVTRGVFAVDVEDILFNPFTGSKRFLEIEVRRPAGVGVYTLLSPRVELLPTPYAHYARSAGFAQSVGFESVTSSSIQDGAVSSNDIDPGLLTLLSNPTTLAGIPSSGYMRNDVNNFVSGPGWVITSGTFTFGGANLTLSLGDTGFDIVEVPGELNVDGDTTLGNTLVSATLSVNGNTILGDATNDATFIAGAATMATNLTVNGNTTLGDATNDTTFIAGAATVATNLNVNGNTTLGDTTADTTAITGPATIGQSLTMGGNILANKILVMSQTEGDQTIFFHDSGSTTASRIMWDDVTSISCAPFGTLGSIFLWDIDASTNTGWVFRDGSDYEVFIDEAGNIVADGAVTPSSGCDVAESFFAEGDLAPGTVVAIAHGRLEVVEPSRIPYQRGLVGVVSSHPGVLLDGPSVDTLPLVREHKALAELLALAPDDEDLARRYVDLELAIDVAPRGNVPVALAGRVPVLVVGAVSAGQALTSSHVAGHAMVLDRPGPALGIALESKSSEGPGEVLMLVQAGYHVPGADDALDGPLEVPAPTTDDLDARLARVESLLTEHGLADSLDGTFAERAAAEPGIHAGRDARADGGPGGTDAANPGAPVASRDTRGGSIPIGPAVATRVPFAKEAWGDFDADGRDDVLVLDPGGTSSLHRNLGGGHFLDVTADAGLGDLAGLRAAAWQDYDGDARLDLLLVDRSGVASLFKGRGAGRFDDVTSTLGVDFGRPIVSAEWLDHDHDGRPDLRVAMDDGRIVLHHNLGQGAFRGLELRASSAVEDDRVATLEAQVAQLQAQLAALLAQQGGVR